MFVIKTPVQRLWLALVAALAACLFTPATADDGTWETNASGTWDNSANWAGAIIADGSGRTARFTHANSEGHSIVLGSPRTIGNLEFSAPGASAPPGPLDPVAGLLPHLATAADGRLLLRFPYDPAKSDLAWIIRASPDLDDWSDVFFDSRHDDPPATDPAGWAGLPVPATRHCLFLRLEILRK